MDVKRYIASGILEQYVLDNLSDEERRDVERNVAEYPAIKAELDSIESALYLFSLAKTKTPPPGLEEVIMNNLNTEIIPKKPIQQQKPKTGTPAFANLKMLLGAGLAIAAGIAAFLFFNNRNLQTEISNLKTQIAQQSENCDSLRTVKEGVEKQLIYLRESKIVPLKGTKLLPEAMATIYYNTNEQSSYLDINNLPAPPSDLQYQLWAIIDGTPVDMGVFELFASTDALKEVPFLTNVTAFAVTLEARGGVVSPTLEQMYVYGEFIS